MNQRWQRGISPFDGDCLVTDELFTVLDLRILITVAELERDYATQTLFTFDDWHQHDGYITDRRVTDWGTLTALTSTADSLIESRQGDTYVHCSLYPENFSFLLRYDVCDEDSGDETVFTGSFDLSGDARMISQFRTHFPPSQRHRVRIEPSKSYFDRTYAG